VQHEFEDRTVHLLLQEERRFQETVVSQIDTLPSLQLSQATNASFSVDHARVLKDPLQYLCQSAGPGALRD
jgi:hypothetical protein